MSEFPKPAVLLVEDDPTNQLIALSMLRHLGIEADSAPNGQAGVSMALASDYDVVLMDIQMPVMDGVESMRSIRALLPPDRCPRILAVTAHAVSGTRERLLAAGFDGFYNKPLSIALLEEALTPPAASATPPSFVSRSTATRDGESAEARARLTDSVRAHVRALLGEDDDAFADELMASFASSSREAVAEAQAAQRDRDAAAAAAAAHKLKGGAANVGLDALTEVWGGVETQMRQGAGLDEVAAPLSHAIDQTERTLALLAV